MDKYHHEFLQGVDQKFVYKLNFKPFNTIFSHCPDYSGYESNLL
jgi:hypothetical protein